MKLLPLAGALLVMTTGMAGAQVKTTTVEYKVGDVTCQGFLSYDASKPGKRPGVLIIHDWFGVSDYTKMRAEQLAALGYVALTADVYGKGVRPANAQEARAEAGKYYQNRKLLREREKGALEYLLAQPQTDGSRLAVIGYCFGGMGALELARAGAPLKAIVTFHGGLASTDPSEAKNIRGKVLVLHGADDPNVTQADVTKFMDEMRAAGVDWQLVQYGGAVHSFTDKRAGNDNSKGAAYNEKADKRSWRAMQDFFDETLK